MYQLVVIAGPNKGERYNIDGEISIGRQAGNIITLPSSKISKRHCSVMVEGNVIRLQDLGSSNGTFVNGMLAKTKTLKPGDRISVGDVVLELVQRKAAQRPVALEMHQAQVIAFPGQHSGMPAPTGTGLMDQGVPHVSASAAATMDPLEMDTPPADLKGKVFWYFEKHVMPNFYGMLMKYQWRTMLIGLFAAFIIGNLIISVHPLIQSNRASIVKEAGRRARTMARMLVERNMPALIAQQETKTEIGLADREPGVRMAVLIDMDNRIIAPQSKYNQSLLNGIEARTAVRARDLFRGGRETGIEVESDDLIVSVEPIKVLSPQLGKNVVVGMAVVSIETSQFTLDFGDIGTIYSENLILTGLLAAFIIMVIYRMTLKPLQILNEDMDRALKGEMSQVTHEFRFEELTSLWEIINSAIQRVPRSSAMATPDAVASSFDPSELWNVMKLGSEQTGAGVILFDANRKIVGLSSAMEEISGIREDNAVGQDISAVARDQALIALCSDLFDRATPGTDGVVEEYEFSGVGFKVSMAAVGLGGAPAKAYVLSAVKVEG